MYIIDCLELELYTNDFECTKFRRNYVLGEGVRERKRLNASDLDRLKVHSFSDVDLQERRISKL
jgi:hypothetical protein